MSFLSSDDLFPITAGSESFFSPGALAVDDLPPVVDHDDLTATAPLYPASVDSTTASSSRKRARNSSLSPPSPEKRKSATGSASGVPNASDLANKLRSKDLNEVAKTLNTLLKLSTDQDLNYALGRHGEKVIDSLVHLFDEIIGWKHGQNGGCNNDDMDDNNSDLVPTSQTWKSNASPSNVGNKTIDDFNFPTFCSIKFGPSSLNTAMTPSHFMPKNLLTDMCEKEDLKKLEIIIMIARNLSYVQGNVRFLTHSVGMMRILTGSLYFRNFMTGKSERGPKSERDESDLETGNSQNNMCLHAIHTLSNLSPSLDTTGRKLFLDLFLLDGETITKASKNTDSIDVKSIIRSEQYGQINSLGLGGIMLAKHFNVKDDSFTKIPDAVTRPVVYKYIRATLAIFPAIYSLLCITTSRSVVVSTLEFMILLVDNAENHPIFTYISDEILHQLVRLLFIPRLGRDSLEYIDPMINVVSRVSAMKLLGGYDSAVDYELRDRAIEILVRVTALNADLKRRVGRRVAIMQTDRFGLNKAITSDQPNVKLYDAVIPALTTKVGRDQTPLLAAKLLRSLAEVPENSSGILYAERKIIRALSNIVDNQVANVLCIGVLNQFSRGM